MSSQGAQILAFPRRHDRLVDKRTAARELSVGIRTLERMMAEGLIEFTRLRPPNGAVRFRWSVIEDVKRRGTSA